MCYICVVSILGWLAVFVWFVSCCLSVYMHVCMLVEMFSRLEQLAVCFPRVIVVYYLHRSGDSGSADKSSSPQCHLFLRETYFYSCGVSRRVHNNIWYSVQLMNIIFLHAKREITNTIDNPLFLRDISALWFG